MGIASIHSKRNPRCHCEHFQSLEKHPIWNQLPIVRTAENIGRLSSDPVNFWRCTTPGWPTDDRQATHMINTEIETYLPSKCHV